MKVREKATERAGPLQVEGSAGRGRGQVRVRAMEGEVRAPLG